MEWMFWKAPGPWQLPARVKKDLVAQFRMGPERVAALQYVERPGMFAGRPVRYVRIFDPALIQMDPGAITHYEQVAGRAVLFEGWFEMSGIPVLNDVRQGVSAR